MTVRCVEADTNRETGMIKVAEVDRSAGLAVRNCWVPDTRRSRFAGSIGCWRGDGSPGQGELAWSDGPDRDPPIHPSAWASIMRNRGRLAGGLGQTA